MNLGKRPPRICAYGWGQALLLLMESWLTREQCQLVAPVFSLFFSACGLNHPCLALPPHLEQGM